MSSKAILESHPWINLDFVQKLVNNSNENSIVNSFFVEKGVGDGKNFSSHTIRLIVYLVPNNNPSKEIKQQKVYFLKICLQTEEFLKACEESFYYEKESEIYNTIIPAVEKLLKSIELPTQIAPKSV